MEEHPDGADRPVATPVRQERPSSPNSQANAGLPAKPPVHLESWELLQDAQPQNTWVSSPVPTLLDSTEKPEGDNRGGCSMPKDSPQKSEKTDVPVVPATQPSPKQHDEDSEESDEDSEIPNIDDKNAPRFAVDQHHISQNAIKQRAKRIFTKRVDGSMKVSETIFNEWKGKGKARKNLEQIFKSVGYDPDPCVCFRYVPFIFCSVCFQLWDSGGFPLVSMFPTQSLFSAQDTFCCEVEVLRQEMQSTELSVEGEFLSFDGMIEKGISEYFGETTRGSKNNFDFGTYTWYMQLQESSRHVPCSALLSMEWLSL